MTNTDYIPLFDQEPFITETDLRDYDETDDLDYLLMDEFLKQTKGIHYGIVLHSYGHGCLSYDKELTDYYTKEWSKHNKEGK